MARGFMYVYERIYREEKNLQKRFERIPVNGRKTSSADIRRIKQMLSDSSFCIAQECSVIVNYPKWRIEGTKVVLGECSILLPDCRLIGIEELKRIEAG